MLCAKSLITYNVFIVKAPLKNNNFGKEIYLTMTDKQDKKSSKFIKRSKKLIKKSLVVSSYFSTVILFLLVSVIGSGWIWLNDYQEKSLDCKLLRYAEKLYNRNKIYKIHIDNPRIKLAEDGNVLVDVGVTVDQNSTENRFLEIRNVHIDFDTSNFLRTLSLPTNVTVAGAHLNLNNLPHAKTLSTSKQKSMPFLEKGLGNFTGHKLFQVKKLEIFDSSVTRDNIKYSVTQTITESDNGIISNTTFSGKDKTASIRSLISRNNDTFKMESTISRLPTWLLIYASSHEYFYQINPALDSRSEVDGFLEIAHHKNQPISHIALNLKSHNVIPSSIFSSIEVKAETDTKGYFHMRDLKITTPNNGQITANAAFDRDITLKNLNVKVTNVDVDQLQYLWPSTQFSQAQKWVTTSLSKGKCNANFAFDTNKKHGESFKLGTITFQNLKMDYSEKFDALTNMRGHMDIFNDYLIIKVSEGQLKDATIFDGTTTITYSEDDVTMVIDLKSKGDVQNYRKFLVNPSLTSEGNIFDIKKINGLVNTDIKIKMPLGVPNTEDFMDINAIATIKNANSKTLNGLEIKSESLNMTLDNRFVILNGIASINTVPCNLHVVYNLKDSKDFIAKTSITSSINSLKFISQDLANKIHVQDGYVPIEITHLSRKNGETINAKFDTEFAQILLSDLGFTKRKNDNSKLNLELIKDHNAIWKTKSCNFRSDDLDAKFNLEALEDFSQIKSLDSDIVYKSNNIKIKYSSEKDKNIIKVYGNEINLDSTNLQNLLKLFSHDETTTSTSKKQNQYLWSVQIDKLLMKNDIVFHDIVGNFDCTKHHCVNSGFSMKIDKNDFLEIYLNDEKGPNTWIFRTNNAASCLKGLGIYKDIEGGLLEAEVHYAHNGTLDKNSTPSMVGSVRMQKFHALKTPIITKLILLSPFSVIQSLEKSSLIPFDTMEASFVFSNQKLEINRSYAIGDMLAVKLDGSIDGKKDKMDIKGRVIPKSKINTALASFKGKNASKADKEGVVGNDFNITGQLGDPSVNMNPIGAVVSFLLRLTPIGLV